MAVAPTPAIAVTGVARFAGVATGVVDDQRRGVAVRKLLRQEGSVPPSMYGVVRSGRGKNGACGDAQGDGPRSRHRRRAVVLVVKPTE